MKPGLIIPGRVQSTSVPGSFSRGASNGSTTFPRFSVGTGSFSISVWIYHTSGHSGNIATVADNGGAGVGVSLYVSTDTIRISGTTNIYIGTTALTNDAWNHVEWNRDGSGNNRVFINGVLDATGTTSNSSNWGSSGADWQVGGATFYGAGSPSVQYIDELAILVGDLFHSGTSSFTPETAAYTSAHAKYSAMNILLHFDEEAFADQSSYARAVTMVGTAARDITTFKF